MTNLERARKRMAFWDNLSFQLHETLKHLETRGCGNCLNTYPDDKEHIEDVKQMIRGACYRSLYSLQSSIAELTEIMRNDESDEHKEVNEVNNE